MACNVLCVNTLCVLVFLHTFFGELYTLKCILLIGCMRVWLLLHKFNYHFCTYIIVKCTLLMIVEISQ